MIYKINKILSQVSIEIINKLIDSGIKKLYKNNFEIIDH